MKLQRLVEAPNDATNYTLRNGVYVPYSTLNTNTTTTAKRYSNTYQRDKADTSLPDSAQGSRQGHSDYRNRLNKKYNADYVDSIIRGNTTLEEKQVALQNYFKERYANRYAVIEPAFIALSRIYLEIGAQQTKNPFVNFLDRFVSRNPSGRLSNDGVDALNNMYARYDLSPEDIMGDTSDGLDSIIFNNSLYTYSTQDVTYLVTSYFWLDNRNTKQVDFNSILNANNNVNRQSGIKKLLLSFGLESPITSQNVENNNSIIQRTDYKILRDIIIFVDGDSRKAVRNASTVRQILMDGARKYNYSSSNTKTADKDKIAQEVLNYIKNSSNKNKKQLVQYLYNNGLGSIVKQLENEGALKDVSD